MRIVRRPGQGGAWAARGLRSVVFLLGLAVFGGAALPGAAPDTAAEAAAQVPTQSGAGQLNQVQAAGQFQVALEPGKRLANSRPGVGAIGGRRHVQVEPVRSQRELLAVQAFCSIG